MAYSHDEWKSSYRQVEQQLSNRPVRKPNIIDHDSIYALEHEPASAKAANTTTLHTIPTAQSQNSGLIIHGEAPQKTFADSLLDHMKGKIDSGLQLTFKKLTQEQRKLLELLETKAKREGLSLDDLVNKGYSVYSTSAGGNVSNQISIPKHDTTTATLLNMMLKGNLNANDAYSELEKQNSHQTPEAESGITYHRPGM
jgi:hypothetical protein